MFGVRVGALIASLCLLQPALSQGRSATPPLDAGVIALLDAVLATERPELSSDRLWQATAAAHGDVEPLIVVMRERIKDGGEVGCSRLLSGVLRYQGRPLQALRVIDAIALPQRTDRDLLLRAELLDTMSRVEDAARAYDDLLERDLEPALRRRILFRRALVGSDSIEQLTAFASSPANDRGQRNQAAIILALRDKPAASLDLYEVSGVDTDRFRQLVRLAEWALAAGSYSNAQEWAWEAVQVAKMRRDRRYALTVVVSAYRAGGAIDALLERLEQSPELKQDARQVWIDLLRDEGRVDDALRLFRQGGDGEWTPALRRQLLEICRETGREDVLIKQFRELMAAEPGNLEWRSGLSRHFLESGDRKQAALAWQDFGVAEISPQRQLEAAYSLMDLGLDDLALRAANVAALDETLRETAQLFVVKLHVDRGRFDEAGVMLAQIEEHASGKDAVLAEVAGIYERMDRLDRAVLVLDRMREAFGGFLGTDLDMKYALLLSKVDRESDALKVWRSLWAKVRSTPRGRYVEDRMMTVAARLGVLAKIAIELEDKLDAGTADTTDVELLVRLYVKVGDSAAATEITEQALRGSSLSDIDIIRRKATIYLACNDYVEYENLIELLIERDPENRLDHMRELTLSRLERGRRAQAIEKLPDLRAISEDSGIADEFEAGIYQLAGLKEPALKSYMKGLGRFPDRIDTHLLVANLMRETGREMEAARRFQYLASTAERDDLFTIAIDGILNLRAQTDTSVPTTVVEWAMRVTLERLAERSHRFYLHRLAADLAEEMGDMPMSIRTLTAGLPVAGERRTALLREILGKIRSLDKNARTMFGGSRAMKISDEWDAKPYVMIGRRLLGQGEIVPPQVYMDLAAVFLKEDAVGDAMRTFSRAAELLDRGEVHRQAAAVLEGAGRYDAALAFYRRLLSVDVNDVGLLVKIGRLEELAGRDVAACSSYQQGLEVALQQTPTRVHPVAESKPDPDDLLALLRRQGSVDAIQSAWPKLIEGLLVTLPEVDARRYLQAMREDVAQDLAKIKKSDGDNEAAPLATIDQFPRLRLRAEALRRLSLCFRQLDLSDAVDRDLLQLFSTDRELAKASLDYRLGRGFDVSATRLTQGTSFASDPDYSWMQPTDEEATFLSPAVAAARIVPMLVQNPGQVRQLLERLDTASLDAGSLSSVPALLGACVIVGATDAGERIARAGLRITASLNSRDRIVLGNRLASLIVNLGIRLDPAVRERLVSFRVNRAAAQGAAALVQIQFELNGEKDLYLDADLIEDMLRKDVANSAQQAYGLRSMPLLRHLTPDRRAPLVRELYTAAPASQRLNVLADSGDFLKEPLTDPFVEWYETAYEREFRNADMTRRRRAVFIRSQDSSPRIRRLRLEATMKYMARHREWLLLVRAVHELDDAEGVRDLLERGIPDLLTKDDLADLIPNRPKNLNKGQVGSALRLFTALGLANEVREIVEAKLKQSPRHKALLYAQWLLRTQMPGADSFVEQAVAKGQNSVDVLGQFVQYQRSRGRLVEAAQTLQRLIDLDQPQAAKWRVQLAVLHRQLSNLDKAEALQDPKKLPVSVRGKRGVAGVAMLAPRPGRRITPARASEPTAKSGGAVVVEDRLRLRQKWRGRDDGRQVISSLYPRPNIAINERDLEKLRGKDYASGEARRMLRLVEDLGLLESRGLLASLLKVLRADKDPVAKCKERLDKIADGRAGTMESVRLLMSMATSELPDEVRIRIVQSFLDRREAPDEARLRSLANELIRMDKPAEAASLYRLGLLVGDGGRRNYLRRGEQEKPADVIADVQSRLGGELGRKTAVMLVEDLLAANDSVEATLAALAVWPTLLSEEQCQSRVLELYKRLEEQRSAQRGIRVLNRQAMQLVGAFAQAFARSGQDDLALEQLAKMVFVAMPDDYGRVLQTSEVLLKKQLTTLLDAEVEDPDKWLRSVGEAVIRWQEQKNIGKPSVILGLVGVRMGDVGHKDLAMQCAKYLSELAADDTYSEQRLAYVHRANGDADGAWAIERKLLTEQRLAIQDHGRVLLEMHDRDGVVAAFDFGKKVLTYTRHSEVLTAMVQFAEELGDTEPAATWRAELKKQKEKTAAEEAAVKPKRR